MDPKCLLTSTDLQTRRARCQHQLSFLFYVWLCANFQFSWWSRDNFLSSFRGLYLPNAWSRTLQNNKKHTFRVSAFYRYHRFGVKLFPVGCAHCTGQSKRTLKREKCCFLIWLRPCFKIPDFFHDSTRPHLHFDGLPLKSRPTVVSI